MIKALYGNLKVSKKSDWIILPFKVVYIIYTLPYLIIVGLAYFRTPGLFQNPLKEKFGFLKKILLHFSAIIYHWADGL